MLKVYSAETKQMEASERSKEVSSDPKAEGFIEGLYELRNEYNQTLDVFEENHRKVYNKVKGLAGEGDYILLCLKERWGLSPQETNFGIADIQSSFIGVHWRNWTTVNLQRSLYPNLSGEEIFKTALKSYISQYFDQKSVKIPILVSDQHNFQRCLAVLDEMEMEYEVMT